MLAAEEAANSSEAAAADSSGDPGQAPTEVASPAAPVSAPADSKEAGRVAAFRLLRAKKVVLALAAGEDEDESSDED